MLDGIDLSDHIVGPAGPKPIVQSDLDGPSGAVHESNFHLEKGGLVAYHGPTSIYRLSMEPCRDSQVLALAFNHSTTDQARDLHTLRVAQDFGIGLQDEIVIKGLRQFFRWQYPYFMFIYREAFLRDHFSNAGHRPYWSGALLFAMCSLGLLMMPGKEERAASESFFAAAETILLVSGISQPCITTVQAFLCLALYEIGRGNLSKGWGFSGG